MRIRRFRPLLVRAWPWSAAAALAASRVLGAAPSFDLVWRAPAECPSGAEMVDRVGRLLGDTSRSRATARTRVRATVEHSRSWRVVLDTESSFERGRRTIEATSCEGLADATALIVALMIDPDAEQRMTAPSTAPPSPVGAPVAPPSVAATPASSAAMAEDSAQLAPLHARSAASRGESTSEQRPTWLVGAQMAGNVGVLPSAELGVGAGLGFTYARWRIELRGTYGLLADYRSAAPAPEGAYGEFRWLSGTLAGCADLGRGFAWGICLDVELGVLRASGSGATRNFHPTTLWVGLGGGAFVAPTVGKILSFPLHLDVIVPVRRPVFFIENTDGSVFQPSEVGARATLGAEIRF